MSDFDPRKDYYEILGVTNKSTIDEIKAAHINLALRYHPDTANDIKLRGENNANFLAVSEAWSVLSKPLIRQKYDAERNLVLGVPASIYERGLHANKNSNGLLDADLPSVPSAYELRYKVTQDAARKSDWKDYKDKYRTERWQKSTTSHKKTARSMSINTKMGVSKQLMVGLGVGLGLAGLVSLYSDGLRGDLAIHYGMR